MKKVTSILFILLLCTMCAVAQQYDKTWLTGYGANWQPDSLFGNICFTFSDTGVVIKRDSLGMNFDRGSSTISDNAGNLLFYTNGIDIRNANDEIMQNGDSLGKGWFLEYYGHYFWGHRMPKLHAVFPITDSSFYMVYMFGDSIYMPKAHYSKILLALIEPYANNGKGRVVFKDSVLLSDTLLGQLAVTKDADAKGWWIVGQIAKTNCYPVLYVDSSGKVEYKQRYCGGGSNTGYEFAAMDFTKDGSKLVVAGSHYSGGRVNVFDFNRCTGELSIIEIFSHPTIRDSTRIVQGVESSPNSRYMYLFAGLSIIQLDLAAASIAGSAQTVAYMDTFAGETAVTFFSGQLGIDGRIYVCGGSGYKYVHRINQPDKGGLACEVQQCYHKMPAFILGLPRYPNYRLGAANCTGVGINEAAINKVRMGLYPNPASSTLQVEYNYINWEQSGSIQLTLTDATGRSIHSQALPMYSALQNIDVSQLASGVYFVSLSAKERTIANGRFVKE